MSNIADQLGAEAKDLLEHKCETISKDSITLPGPNYVDNIFINSDRNNTVLRNLQSMYDSGRLAGSGVFD